MKYRGYSSGDFAIDSFFIRWVKNPDEESEWFWRSFMKDNPACVPAIEEARKIVASVTFPSHKLRPEERQAMHNRMLMALRAEKEEHRDRMSERSVGYLRPVSSWMKVAASVLIVLAFTSGLYLLFDIDATILPSDGSDGPVTVEHRSNPAGQKSVLFLADGSKVWLNAASNISYLKDFTGQSTREVHLDGEAFFEVAHNPEKPFVVHTPGIRIKVLGTSFNVRAYDEEEVITTTLVTGKVRIEQSEEQGRTFGVLELKPSQRAEFDKQSRIVNIREVEGDHASSWKEDRLVFDEESIDNVLRQLERRYQVDIHVANRGNLRCTLTARIERESLQEVLKLLEVSHNIRYTITGRDVFIEGNICKDGR